MLYPGSNTTGSANVSLSPSGTLNYFQNFMGDMKLNGQLYLGNGSATYKMPMMAGSKKFTFKPESNVSWSGDIMMKSIQSYSELKVGVIYPLLRARAAGNIYFPFPVVCLRSQSRA